MSDHPSVEELSALVEGNLPAQRSRALIRHLLQPCEHCLAQAPPSLRLLLGLEPVWVEPTPEEDAAYEAAMDRAFRRAVRERNEVAKATKILAGGGLEAILKLPVRMGLLPKMEALLARSWELRHESPALMIAFAKHAALCSDHLDAREHGVHRVADLRCRAHAELGNAYRTGDQLPQAAAELDYARRVFETGTRDKFLEVRLVELEASLAADYRQFALAANNLLKVHDFYQRHGDHHMAGRALILRGLYTGYAGEPEEGCRLLGEGLALIDESRDPGLAYAAVHNQLLFLIDSGRFDEARKFRLRNSRQLADHRGRVNEIRFRWLEGRIDAGRKKYVRAEAIYREVKAGFKEVGRLYHLALLRLDLSAALLAQGKETDAEEEAREAARVFLALEIEREVLMAVLMLRHAFEEEMATVELVEEVADFVRRAEHDPNARFDPDLW